MNKNTFVKYLLLGLVFLGMLFIGILCGNYIKNHFDQSDLNDVVTKHEFSDANSNQGKGANSIVSRFSEDAKSDSAVVLEENQKDVSKAVLSATPPVKSGETYSFSVRVEGIPGIAIRFELWNSKCIKKSSDGRFTEIPASASGYYTVLAIDCKTNQEICRKEVKGFVKGIEKMSKSEFQALLLNLHDTSLLGGKHPKVAKKVNIQVTNLRSGERRPGVIYDVREKILNGLWASVRVDNVGYNEKGQINSATLTAVYSEE